MPVLEKPRAGCYEPNYVPIQNLYVEVLNPSIFRNRAFILFIYLEVGLLKVIELKCGHGGGGAGRLIQHNWYPCKKRP